MSRYDYLIRYRYQNNGLTRSIIISAESQTYAMVQFKELYPKCVPVGMYSMTRIELNDMILNVTRADIPNQFINHTGPIYQCMNNHVADIDGNCNVDGCPFGPSPQPKEMGKWRKSQHRETTET